MLKCTTHRYKKERWCEYGNQEKAEKCIWRGLYLLQQCKEKVDGSN